MFSCGASREDDWLNDEKKLIAGIAHEIKNPLAAIHGFLQLLGQRVAGDIQATRYVDMTIRELHRLQELVEDYLHFGRIKHMELGLCDVEEIVQRVVQMVRQDPKAQDVDFQITLADDVPKIMASARLLQQLFWNLISNAIGALPHGGSIIINLRKTDAVWLTCSCRDTGIGIAPANLALIFEPYYTTKGSGTGLGLVISRLIVQAHGGRLEVDSQMGSGTTFTVWLPLDRMATEGGQ